MFKKPPPMIVMSVYELDLALLYSLYMMLKHQKLKTRLKVEAAAKVKIKSEIRILTWKEFKLMVEFKASKPLDSLAKDSNKNCSKFGTFFDIINKAKPPATSAVK